MKNVNEDIPNPVDTLEEENAGEMKLAFIFIEWRKLERNRHCTMYLKRLLVRLLMMLKKTKNVLFVKPLRKQKNVKSVVKISALIAKSKCMEKVSVLELFKSYNFTNYTCNTTHNLNLSEIFGNYSGTIIDGNCMMEA
jgi:hypothetical protein